MPCLELWLTYCSPSIYSCTCFKHFSCDCTFLFERCLFIPPTGWEDRSCPLFWTWLCLKNSEWETERESSAQDWSIIPPFSLAGDIHGQYKDLLRIFEEGCYPPLGNFLFLGDYVDRGKRSLETICLLLAYKVRYPENVFLLRGNHECAAINRIYGFFDECEFFLSLVL